MRKISVFFSSLFLISCLDLKMIDLNDPSQYETGSHDWDYLDKRFSAFNGAIEFGKYFDFLGKAYQIGVVVETGTFKGQTTGVLSYLFPEVHTIESDQDLYLYSKNEFSGYSNIFLHYGNSPEELSKILSQKIGSRILFYLDAHSSEGWPLLKEIETIGKTHKDNCILVIDDFKVPGRRDIPFDSYNGKDCSYAYIKDELSKVFSSYSYHYVIPKKQSSRAKFVAIPKCWEGLLENSSTLD